MKMRLKDGKTKVLTLSYDDGVVQDIRLSEILNRYGLKCTFNINSGTYLAEDKVREVFRGRLKHTPDGFVLDGCDGKLHYEQSPICSYTLNSEFYFYEIGDVISIGNAERLYYCFPKSGESVAKARLAAEEIYKIKMPRRRGTDKE